MALPNPSRTTLADVLIAVQAAPMAERRRQDMTSAVRCIARVLGHSPADVPADLRALNAKLKQASPMAIGMSAARWNNVRSLLRSALALIGPMVKGRGVTPLSGEWAGLHGMVSVRSDRIRLSRLLRWLSVQEISPATVTVEELERFHRMLTEEALLHDPAATWANTVRAWNRAVVRVVGWPQVTIRRELRRQIYGLPWSAFPQSLKLDVEAWLARLSGRDFAEEGPTRPLGPVTLKAREYELRIFVSALVHRGRDPTSLLSLAVCLTLENFTEGLRFFYARFGGKPSATSHNLSANLKSVARHWVGADDETLRRMADITRKLSVERSGLTQKNRERLLPFNDPVMCRKLLVLPLELQREIKRGKLPEYRHRVLGQMAVAIEILLFVPIRIKNLAALEIDRHLVKAGKKLLLTIPSAEVKNRANDLDFELPEPTADLVRWYLKEVRRSDAGNMALFPGASGSHKDKDTLGIQITQTVHKYTGLQVNPHLFRHLAAKLYLDQNPGGYEVMRRVFGHKKMDTTSNFYAGLETRGAARHFGQEILKLRTAAASQKPA